MRLFRLFTALATACALTAAAAQPYPTRTVKIIVPFTAGSSTDILGRVVAEHLTTTLGQPFIVENKPGAGGSIGTELAAKSAPDGCTLIMAGSGPFGVNPALEAKLPYDAVKDFEPIANVGLTPQVFAVGPSAKFRNLKDFVAAAKASPGTIDYGSLGKGTTGHLAMKYFQSAAGMKAD
jgi:tripartite-type tricarboxylate transporter receptor subunit TctC